MIEHTYLCTNYGTLTYSHVQMILNTAEQVFQSVMTF